MTLVYKLAVSEAGLVGSGLLRVTTYSHAEALRRPVSDDLIGHEMIGSAKVVIGWAKLLIEEATRLSLRRPSKASTCHF